MKYDFKLKYIFFYGFFILMMHSNMTRMEINMPKIFEMFKGIN